MPLYNSKTPIVPEELIEYLESVYQNNIPKVDDTLSKIQRDAGQQDVISHLRTLSKHSELYANSRNR